MTGFWPGLVSLAVALLSGVIIDTLLKLPSTPGRIITAVAFFVSLHCSALGIFHALTNWGFIDLLGDAQARDMSLSGKQTVAVIFIMFWPFVMMVFGLVGAYIYSHGFRKLSSRS